MLQLQQLFELLRQFNNYLNYYNNYINHDSGSKKNENFKQLLRDHQIAFVVVAMIVSNNMVAIMLLDVIVDIKIIIYANRFS